MYADHEPHTMWAWNPLSKNKHQFRLFFNFTDNAADHIHGWRQSGGYACGTFMSLVWSSPSSQVPSALGPARPGRRYAYPYQTTCTLKLILKHLEYIFSI